MNEAVTTHSGDWDTLLVRIGHYLWKWHKQDERNQSLVNALEDVWRVKREYRKPIATQRDLNRVLAGERLREMARERRS